MTWPGLGIRCSYLWKNESDAGREDGIKDRPWAVVLAMKDDDSRTRVLVLPVTHSPPGPTDEGIQLPRSTKQRLGLDNERSWISEANEFSWP